MNVYGSNELARDVQQAGYCIGCGACVELCPYFRNHRGHTARLFACSLEQGRCHAHCPKTEVDLEELSSALYGEKYEGTPLGHYRSILAARATGKVAGPFQGGGTVSALATYALESKLIDAAILTGADGMRPVPQIVTDPDKVARCGSSRFTAAPTLSVMNQAVRQGMRRLGVVGTPCQMTAVAQMKQNPLGIEDFEDPVALTIGLFCNWALEHKQLAAYLANHLDLDSITGMDIPPPPAAVMVVKTQDTEHQFPLEEIRPLIPLSCFICPDMTSEWADVSVGMYEGRPGWNTLIVRSEAGAELVEGAVSNGWIETEAFPGDRLQELAKAALAKKERSFRNANRRGLLQEGENGARPAMKVPQEVLDRLLA